MKPYRKLIDKIDQKVFEAVYSRSLVYNTCWEDPAVDRQALQLGPEDHVLVITSAGCNALDYALAGVARVHAVDANPRQTALLELKLAAIRRLSFEDFFSLFGRGRHPRVQQLFDESLSAELTPFARQFWAKRLHWFNGRDPADTFYFHGLAGTVARGFRAYSRLRPGLRPAIEAVFDANDLERQREVYDRSVAPIIWTNWFNWILSRQFTLNFLGVPHTQRKEVQAQHEGGVAGFVHEAIDYVFRNLPARTNYFWALYLFGSYTPVCCPGYLKEEGFNALKNGLVDRVSPHTCTVTQFLDSTSERISRFVLLDHMDWMSSANPKALEEEWAGIMRRAAPGARVIFRSAHAAPAYLHDVFVDTPQGRQPITQALRFHPALAEALQQQDRVHTYAGFHIADLPA